MTSPDVVVLAQISDVHLRLAGDDFDTTTLSHATWDGSAWSGWSLLGGTLGADPATFSRPTSGTVELALIAFLGHTTELMVAGS
ncbi:MAG TPA: hypothetical protein VOB72_22735 [Candidatus Dormibacteraeota bacterium]|nr:hypothetical protein [Candidatus Dormibacteraeota bacterium]